VRQIEVKFSPKESVSPAFGFEENRRLHDVNRVTKFLVDRAPSTLRVYPEDGGSTTLRNIGNYLPNYTVSDSRKQ
jgi:hypothetical protein